MSEGSETSFFEEQAAVEVGEKLAELFERRSIDIDDLARSADIYPDDLREKLESGGLTIRELAKVLYHMNYRMLFTVKPMTDADRKQGEDWRNHE